MSGFDSYPFFIFCEIIFLLSKTHKADSLEEGSVTISWDGWKEEMVRGANVGHEPLPFSSLNLQSQVVVSSLSVVISMCLNQMFFIMYEIL